MTGRDPIDVLKELYPHHLVDGRGQFIALVPMLYTTRLIVVRDPLVHSDSVDEFWCFADALTAISAFAFWQPGAEPEGWVKHSSGRRGGRYASPSFGTSISRYGERGALRKLHMQAYNRAVQEHRDYSDIDTHGRRSTRVYLADGPVWDIRQVP